MSNLFGFSLFSSATDATEPDVPQPVPPERDRTLTSQFFSFFSGDSGQTDDASPAPAAEEAPVSKTLSEMAQKVSSMADDAIRSMTPDQNKPTSDPLGKQPPGGTATLDTSRKGSKLADLVDNTEEPSVPREEPKFPSYTKTKPKKDIPLLAFSQNRQSMMDLDKRVLNIAESRKSEANQGQFTVSNHTGMDMKSNPLLTQQPPPVTEDKNTDQKSGVTTTDTHTPAAMTPAAVTPAAITPVVMTPGDGVQTTSIIVEDVDAPKEAPVELTSNSQKKEAPKLLDIGIVPVEEKPVTDHRGSAGSAGNFPPRSDSEVGFDYEAFKEPPTSCPVLDIDELASHSLCSIDQDNEAQNLIDQLLELGFLTEEEKQKLQKVLAADENLQKTQYNHYIKKHKDLYNERKQCAASADASVCPLCFVKFGWFTNSGDVCPVPACQLKVCNSCRVPVQESWMCNMCHKEKDLKAQAGYWFQQPANNKKRVKTGTDILKKSLDGPNQYSKGKAPEPLLTLAVKEGEEEGGGAPPEIVSDVAQPPQLAQPLAVQPQLTQPDTRSSSHQERVETAQQQPTPKPDKQSSRDHNHTTRGMDEPRENHVTDKSSHVTGHTTRTSAGENHVRQTAGANHVTEHHIPVINHVTPQTPVHPKERTDTVTPSHHTGSGATTSTTRNLKAPHIRDIKGQSLSADSGFINDDHTKEDSGIVELISEDDDDDNSTQFQRYLMARSVAPDELAPQADSPPHTPHGGVRGLVGTDMGEESSRGHYTDNHHTRHEDGAAMSAGASSSNMSCESISPSPTMIKANTKDRQIFGELCIGLVYNQQVSTLDVHINEARGLCGVDGTPPQCYVKTYLLPDRSKTAKRKTKTKKRSSDPVFNEIFQYKAPSVSDLASSTLWLTVWDTRQLGHNMFLGEVRIQLDSISLEKATPIWWQLQHLEDSHFRGSILLSLMYCPSPDDRRKKKTCLKLKVAEARDLPVMDNGRTNPYIALYLIPKTDSKDHKYKLQMKKNTVNPKWSAEVNFMNLDSAVIEDNGIEIQLLHLGKVEKAKQCVLIGVVRLCQHKTSLNAALDGRGIEVLHWKEALSKPGVWVEKWHNLRSWE